MTLAKQSVDVNIKDQHERTPAMVAAKQGNNREFNLLVERNCDLSCVDDDGNSVLHLACSGGNLAVAEFLIREMSFDSEDKNKHGETAIAQAVARGHKSVFEYLVDGDCSVTSTDNDGNSLLHLACESRSIYIVSYLLLLDEIDINSKGKNGTPLMIAARTGNLDILEVLMESKCKHSSPEEYEDNALHIACQNDRVLVVKLLLAKGEFDINGRGKDGKTPLQIAAEKRNKILFDFLVENGADLEQKDDDDSILHVACLGGSEDIVVDLLTKFDINSIGYCGRSPLMMAASVGYPGLCDLLIKRGSNANIRDIKMNNVLHLATLSCDRATVECIPSNTSVDIDSRGEHDQTAMMMAAEKGYTDVFDFLIAKGCDVKVKDDNERTLLHVAVIGNRLAFVRHLTKQNLVDINSKEGKGLTPAMLAANLGYRKVFELLVEHGCDIIGPIVDDDENDILHCACLVGSLEIVDYVVAHNVVDINKREKFGNTPILVAARHVHKVVFDFLVKKGCDVQAVDDSKNNVLHLACLGGYMHFIKYLLSKAVVPIDSKGNTDSTPVMLAGRKGHTKLVKLLIRHDCDLTLFDKDGNNALHLACITGKTDVVKYLLDLDKIDKNCKNGRDETPAKLAFKYNREQVYRHLIAEDCDVSL